MSGGIWLLERGADDGFQLLRIDRDTGAVTASIDDFAPAPMRGDSGRLAVGGGTLWIAAGHALVYRVDSDLNRVMTGINVAPHHLDGLATAGGALLVSDFHMIARVDLATHEVRSCDEAGATGLASGGGNVRGRCGSQVFTVDPDTLRRSPGLDLGAHVLAIDFALGSLWAITVADGDESATLPPVRARKPRRSRGTRDEPSAMKHSSVSDQ